MIATYDESAQLSSLDLEGIALHVRELADGLQGLIVAVPGASSFISIHDELAATGEDLADSSRLMNVPLPSHASESEWELWRTTK